MAAPRRTLPNLVPRDHVGLTTELDDGRFVTTTNAYSGGVLSAPPVVDLDCLPYGTFVRSLWFSQRERTAALLGASPGVRVRPFGSVDDLISSMHRYEVVREAHRRRIGWVSLQELRRMSSAKLQAEAIYLDIQTILRGERERGVG